MDLLGIINARKQIDEANSALRTAATAAINNEVLSLLNIPGITSVSWSQKASEYNDEGMYPGIHGPVIGEGNDEVVQYWVYDRIPGWAYGYDHVSTDSRASNLKTILNALGEEVLSETFGDSSFITATLTSDGRVQYDEEDSGW